MYHDWHLQVHDGGPVRECRDSPATRHLKMVNADQLVLASDQLVPLWKPPVVEKAGGWKGFLQVVKPGEHDTLPVKREIYKSHSGKRFWPKVETYNQHNVSWCTTERKSIGLCIMQSPSSPMKLTGQLAFFSCQNSKEHVNHIVPENSNVSQPEDNQRDRCTDLSGTQWTSLWTQLASSCRWSPPPTAPAARWCLAASTF